MKLAPKLTILFLLLAIVPTAIVGYFAYENGRRTIVQETIDHLISINLFKNNELKRWIEDNKSSIEELAQRPLVRHYAAVLTKHDTPDLAYHRAKVSIVEEHLKPRLKYGDFFELFLMCPRHGLISASTDERQEGKYRDFHPYFIEGKSHTYVQGIYYSRVLEQPAMTISTPIKDKQGNLLGVLAGRLDLGELSKIIALQTGKSPTEDTYLVNTFNFFVTEPRFGHDYALKKATRTEGVEAGLSGRDGTGFYKDYRRLPVMGAYKWLPEFNMCIITEIDQAEAFAPIVRLAWVIAGIASAISIAAALLGLFFARTITRPVQQLAAGAEEISGGNLEYRVGTASKDEIGGLSRAFDRMAESLKATMVSRDELEQHVRDRTAQLEATNKELESEIAVRKQVEEALRESEEKFRSLVDNIGAGISLISPNMEILSMNNPMKTWFPNIDVSKKPICYRAFNNPPREDVCSYCPTYKTLKDGKIHESITDTPVGCEIKNYRIISTPLKDKDGKIIAAIEMVDDITELKRAEEKIKKLNQDLMRRAVELEAINKELEAFSYSVSHDLRAPLRGIDGFSQVLLEDYTHKLDEQGKDYLQRVRAASQRMSQLIDDLLKLSHVTRGEMRWEEIDLSRLVQTIAAELKKTQPKREVEFVTSKGVVVNGDAQLLRVVMENLLGNAWKFTGKHATGRIEFGVMEGDRQEATGKRQRIFYVHDDGAGFDMAYVEKLFVPFQRLHTPTEFPGTGIGLATVQRIIHRHGGRVWAEGEVEKGATFYFTLGR